MLLAELLPVTGRRAVGLGVMVDTEASPEMLLDDGRAQDEDLWKDPIPAPQVDRRLDCTFIFICSRFHQVLSFSVVILSVVVRSVLLFLCLECFAVVVMIKKTVFFCCFDLTIHSRCHDSFLKSRPSIVVMAQL